MQALVSPPEEDTAASFLVELLLAAGLLELLTGQLSITSGGFQFLLKSPSEQAWTILRQYIRKRPEALREIFRLAFTPPSVLMTSANRLFIDEMQVLGFVRRISTHVYMTTPLANALTCNPKERFSTTSEGHIIVETNYRVYAYTTDPLRIGILGLFCQVRGSVGDMTHGSLTQDACRAAFARGITADQIISYLSVHAHPQMYTRRYAGAIIKTVLPPSIVEQIHVWYTLHDRLHTVEETSYLYCDFASASEYRSVLDVFPVATFLYRNDVQSLFVVRSEANEAVKEFLRSRKR